MCKAKWGGMGWGGEERNCIKSNALIEWLQYFTFLSMQSLVCFKLRHMDCIMGFIVSAPANVVLPRIYTIHVNKISLACKGLKY